jgi:hypothetical protein
LLLNNLIDPQWTDGNGYCPKALILDNEFFGLNLDAPVLQTSLLDFSTNKMLVDACIKHEPEAFALKDRFGRRDLTAEGISKTMARRPKAGRHVCTAYECGKLVMKSGITRQDYILEWSNHPLDLPRLRRMLFKSGFQNVLPPNAPIPLFRPSIPRVIPLALEFIFPLLHPGHALIGTNHDSDNDVRMTRLMILFLLQRLNPTTKDPIYLAVWALQEKVRKSEVSQQQKQQKRVFYLDKIAKETPMQKKKRQKDTKEIIRSRRAKETPEKKLRFKLKGEAYRRNRKAAETSEA